jgi:integrase
MNIYKRGNIYWVKFRLDNKLYQYSCRTKDKEVAKEVAAAIQADVIRNCFNIPTKNKAEHLFTETFQEYLQSLTNSQGTIEKKKWHYKHFVKIFGDKSIKDIDVKNYQLVRKLEIQSEPKKIGKKDSQISYAIVNSEIMTLSNFFNFCIEKGYIDKNPCAGIKKLNELSRLKTLSIDDINKLIAGATNKLTMDLISFLVYTGCRKGEALNLKWDDIDIENGVIAIKATKTRYDRRIPISSSLEAVLMGIERNPNCLYVFNKNGAKIGDFKRSFKTACRNAGLKDLHIHDLRHVFASALTMNDVSLYKTGILLGHRTPNMTQRYAHLKPSELKKEIEKAFGKEDHKDSKREEYERALKIIREHEKEKNGGK